MKKDNTTLSLKVGLRREALKWLGAPPVVCETHAGFGEVFRRCYHDIHDGVAFEINDKKLERVTLQRPTWAVYGIGCEQGLAAGLGSHLPVNFLDLDPYGEPWPALKAFFAVRQVPERLVVCVNDGLAQNVKLGGAWSVNSLVDAVQVFGSDLWPRYVEVCRWMIKKIASEAGMNLARFHGYRCGAGQQMTHYAALLTRVGGVS